MGKKRKLITLLFKHFNSINSLDEASGKSLGKGIRKAPYRLTYEKRVEWSKKGTGASKEKHRIKAICRGENSVVSDGRDAESHRYTEKYTYL